MNLIDMHCDTVCELLSKNMPDQDLKKNHLKVDIEKMKRGGSMAQFFACFVPLVEFLGKSKHEQAYEYVRRMATYQKNRSGSIRMRLLLQEMEATSNGTGRQERFPPF